MLEPGQEAPDFTLLDQFGNEFTLSESIKHAGAPHLVYFYPKADTPGCTKQSCGLRDARPHLGNTVVVGISPDPPERQARFDAKYALGFPLLADQDHAVAEAYGTWGQKSMYGRKYMGIIRSAFLVDGNGRIMEAWYNVPPRDTASRLVDKVAGITDMPG